MTVFSGGGRGLVVSRIALHCYNVTDAFVEYIPVTLPQYLETMHEQSFNSYYVVPRVRILLVVV